MSDQVDPRLQRLLGGEHLAPLRKRLRQRFERAPLGGTVDHIRVAGLSAEEHAKLASLLGRPSAAPSPYRLTSAASMPTCCAPASQRPCATRWKSSTAPSFISPGCASICKQCGPV
ncbi:hypothetical protein AJ88_22145 [Mesorhizobium amorphae CCBAU 01583]|nr:hypothetical protein AJ88_22145 [Mesorhizobium amorphae CCBAU 01583]